MRDRPNVLLLHYADLKADLPGAMRRVADFLGIVVPNALWPTLIEAASFGAMRRVGDTLLGETGAAFRGGGDTFFHHGENGRWHGRLDPGRPQALRGQGRGAACRLRPLAGERISDRRTGTAGQPIARLRAPRDIQPWPWGQRRNCGGRRTFGLGHILQRLP